VRENAFFWSLLIHLSEKDRIKHLNKGRNRMGKKLLLKEIEEMIKEKGEDAERKT
jgi:hypothetical protein